MSTEKKLTMMMMMFEPFASGSSGSSGRNSRKVIPFPSSSCIPFPMEKRSSRIGSLESPAATTTGEEMGRRNNVKISRSRQVNEDERFCSKFSHSACSSPPHSKVFHNLAIFLAILMSLSRTVESVPQGGGEKLDSKIKTFLESHCTMQNQTLEQEEFQSFMSCGPSHGAGIVKNLGQIPEYKSDDTEQWARATKREIISQCEVWPKDRSCQETTFRLIEKCFEKDQKFIFYFMFALTDVICQGESDLFIRFWQNGGDSCLGNHIKSLKKDFSECFTKTSTVSSADVYRNFDDVMQCFRSQFHDDCFGDDANEVLNTIMEEIKRVYRTTSGGSPGPATSYLTLLVLLTTWITTFIIQ